MTSEQAWALHMATRIRRDLADSILRVTDLSPYGGQMLDGMLRRAHAEAERLVGHVSGTPSPPATGTTLTELCPHADAVFWNPFNGVVQCHRCGVVFAPITADASPA